MKMVKGWSAVFSLFAGAGVLAGPAPAVADPVESGSRKDVEEHRSALAEVSTDGEMDALAEVLTGDEIRERAMLIENPSSLGSVKGTRELS